MPGTRKVKREKGAGRPRIEIDFELVQELCRIQCTAEEICNILGVCEDTLDARLKEQFGCNFSEYKKRYAGEGKMSLRRQQWTAAMDGNVTMLIWLGKQMLGQRDKHDLDHSGGLAIEWQVGDQVIRINDAQDHTGASE